MLCAELNNKIVTLAPHSFNVSDTAPDTFARLKANSVNLLTVWAGGSDHTIYGDARVNHAFRAWHDSLHLKLCAEFTLQGEILVAREQSRLLGDNYGRIIMAEV